MGIFNQLLVSFVVLFLSFDKFICSAFYDSILSFGLMSPASLLF